MRGRYTDRVIPPPTHALVHPLCSSHPSNSSVGVPFDPSLIHPWVYTSFYRPHPTNHSPPHSPPGLLSTPPIHGRTPFHRPHPWMGVHLWPTHLHWVYFFYPSNPLMGLPLAIKLPQPIIVVPLLCHPPTKFTCPEVNSPRLSIGVFLRHTPSSSKLYRRIISNHHAHQNMHPFFPPSLWLVYPLYKSHASIVLLARSTAKIKQNWQIFEILLFIDYHDL